MTNPPPFGSTLRTHARGPDHLVRALGPTAPEPLTPIPPALTGFARRDAALPWQWRLGVGDGRHRRYAVPASGDPLIASCFEGGGAAARRRSMLGHIGTALARLHDQMPTDDLTGPPPALRRLDSFLTRSVPTRVDDTSARSVAAIAERRRRLFVDALRPGLLDELVHDCRAAMTAGPAVFSHGWHGLDKWFGTPGEGGIGLLGEDLGTAAREHDLASLFAQIVEYHRLVPGLLTDADLEEDKSALLAGYGTAVDASAFDREVRLAVTRHLSDYALHTRGPESEMTRYARLVRSLAPARRATEAAS